MLEDRMLVKKDRHAAQVLFWLGDSVTFDRLLEATRPSGLQKALAAHLAKVLEQTR